MKRDLDLIRKIVLTIEDAESGWAPTELKFDGYTDAQVAHHQWLLIDGGYAAGHDASSLMSLGGRDGRARLRRCRPRRRAVEEGDGDDRRDGRDRHARCAEGPTRGLYEGEVRAVLKMKREERREMPQIPWSKAVEQIQPHVVWISTPRGSGTGFLIWNGKYNAVCWIATAANVVDHAHYWDEPIRIDPVSSGKSVVIRRDQRAVILDINRDTAAVLLNRGELPFPPDPMILAPKDKHLRVGTELASLGFPAIPAATSLCFFAGNVSAFLEAQGAYLVDGVAINGVSGGPAFHVLSGEDPFVVVIGVVSAYVPNRATGEVLPGLSVVRDVSQFHELAPTFASLDQAREAETPAEPPAPPPETEGTLADTPARRST